MAVATLGSIPLFPLSLRNALLLAGISALPLVSHICLLSQTSQKRVHKSIMKTFILGLSSLLSVAAMPHVMTDPEPPSLCDKCKQ